MYCGVTEIRGVKLLNSEERKWRLGGLVCKSFFRRKNNVLFGGFLFRKKDTGRS